MKFPWIKKFFGGEDEEKEVKEKEGLNRRHFLFMIPPAVVVLPELIKQVEMPLPTPEQIFYPGSYPASTFQPYAMSGCVMRLPYDPADFDRSTLSVRKDGKVISLFEIETTPDETVRQLMKAEAMTSYEANYEIWNGIRTRKA